MLRAAAAVQFRQPRQLARRVVLPAVVVAFIVVVLPAVVVGILFLGLRERVVAVLLIGAIILRLRVACIVVVAIGLLFAVAGVVVPVVRVLLVVGPGVRVVAVGVGLPARILFAVVPVSPVVAVEPEGVVAVEPEGVLAVVAVVAVESKSVVTVVALLSAGLRLVVVLFEPGPLLRRPAKSWQHARLDGVQPDGALHLHPDDAGHVDLQRGHRAVGGHAVGPDVLPPDVDRLAGALQPGDQFQILPDEHRLRHGQGRGLRDLPARAHAGLERPLLPGRVRRRDVLRHGDTLVESHAGAGLPCFS